MSGKECWTCKARRVHCDGSVPTCQKCAKGKRECQGYGIRVSWPREGDRRRTVLGKVPPTAVHPRGAHKRAFLHTTWRDMELYWQLSNPSRPITAHGLPGLNRASSAVVDHLDLVHYFHNLGHLSLVTFSASTSEIRDTLLRLALTRDTDSGRALLYSILTFSLVRRHGYHQRTMQFKVAALQSLSVSARDVAMGETEAVQHVAASMLLGASEILLSTESSGEWLHFIRGALNVVQATTLHAQPYDTEIGHLLDWVHYHNALSRFSLYHWRRREKNHAGSLSQSLYPRLTGCPAAPPSANPSHAVLNLLSDMCDTLLDPWDPRARSDEYHLHLMNLESAVRSLPTVDISDRPNNDMLPVDLYKLAMRIFIMRTSWNAWHLAAELGPLIDQALMIPARSPMCTHFFPLFIVACEAATDEQRAAVLGLIDRSEKGPRARSMEQLRKGVLAVWVQQDLHADGYPVGNYLGIMRAVIGSSETLPSFV